MCVKLHPDIVDQVLCLCATQIGFDLEKKVAQKVSICGSETNMLLKKLFYCTMHPVLYQWLENVL